MYYPVAPGSLFYRVTGIGENWPNPVLGLGAYFNKGGRFNRAGDATVYCSEDPLVVICETAFYQALDWQHRISVHRFQDMVYPLESAHRLWCFTIDPVPVIIDLENANTVHQFQYSPHLLLQPSLNPRHGPQLAGQPTSRDYVGTQELADEIRAFVPLVGPRPDGVKAPSVRLKRKHGFQPFQLALFVYPPIINQIPYEQRAVQVAQWELRLRFLQDTPRVAVTPNTVDIDWTRPQFMLRGVGAPAIPAYAMRPKAKPYRCNQWYNLEIRYA